MTAIHKLHQCIGCECCLAKQEKKLSKLANIKLPLPTLSLPSEPLCNLCLKGIPVDIKCYQCNKTLCRECANLGTHCGNGCEVFYCGDCNLFECRSCKMEFCGRCFYDTEHKDIHCEIHCIRCSEIEYYGACSTCYEVEESEELPELPEIPKLPLM